MALYIAKNVLGAFSFDESGKLVDKEFFPKNADEIAQKLKVTELTAEEKALAKRLSGQEIIFERDAPNIAGEILRSELDRVLAEAGITRAEYQELLREVSFALARLGLREFAEEKDRLAIQATAALEDVDESANLLAERLREWYSLHFPELSTLVDEHRKYAQLAQMARDKIAGSEAIEKAARASIGAKFAENDAAAVAGFAKRLQELYELRDELENYISSLMGEIAPNLSALAGPLLGAKLIALAGSLENLARMPASRIQILGAAKALFRSKRTPKHGAIFQHPMIKSAPWWHRGKIARSFAAKIAIAARVDAGSKQNVAEELKQGLERRVEALKKSYSSEPKRMRIIRTEFEKPKRKWRKRR